MGFTVPAEAVIDHGHPVGRPPPLAHKCGAGPGQRACCSPRRIGCFVLEHASQQPIELLGDWSSKAAIAAFLPRIGNAKRQNVASERPRRLPTKLLLPQNAQLSTRQLPQAVDLDIPVAMVKH